MSANFELMIRARRGWQAIDFNKIVLYWELLAFLVSSNLKIRYRQTLLPGPWAILPPFMATAIFSYAFRRLASVQSGGLPYQLFAYAGLAAWIFFSTSRTQSSNILIANHQWFRRFIFSPRCSSPWGQPGRFCPTWSLAPRVALMVVYCHSIMAGMKGE
jgi:lipopolysaccharide transport system permease protein